MLCPLFFITVEMSAQDTLVAHSLLEKARSYDHAQQFDSMYHYASLAAPLFRKAGLGVREASCLILMMRYNFSAGNLQQAQTQIEQAISLLTAELGPEAQRVLAAKNNLAIVLYYYGKEDSALQLVENCIELGQKNEHIRADFLSKFYFVAGEIYATQGRLMQALSTQRACLEYVQEHAPQDSALMQMAVEGMAKVFLRKGDLHNSLHWMLEAQKWANPKRNLIGAIGILSTLAELYAQLEQPQEAIVFIKKGMMLYQQAFGTNNKDFALTQYHYGRYLLQTKQYQESLQSLEQAEHTLTKILPPTDFDRIVVIKEKGRLWMAQGNLEQAKAYFQNAFDLLRTHHPSFVSQLIETGIYLAQTHLELGEVAACEKTIASLDSICEHNRVEVFPNLVKLAKLKTSLALLEHDFHDAQKLLDATASLMVQTSPQPQVTKLTQIKPDEVLAPDNFMEIVKLKANIYTQAFHYSENPLYAKEAFQTLRFGVELLYTQLKKTVLPGRKKWLIEHNKQLFHHGLLIAYELYQHECDPLWLENMLMMATESKSILLELAWEEARARTSGGLKDSLIEQENELLTAIEMNEYHLNSLLLNPTEADPAEVEALSLQLANLKLEHSRWLSKVERLHPHYYQLKYEHNPFDIHHLQQTLSSRHAWVEYAYTDSFLYAFFLTKDGLMVERMQLVNEINEEVQQLQTSIKQKSLYEFAETSHELYQRLLGWIPGLEKYTQLTIAPDGPLCYLPFDLLLSKSSPSQRAPQELPYLFRQHLITLDYSASFLQAKKKKVSKAPMHGRLLALAPELEAGRMQAQSLPEVTRDALLPLAGAKKEVQNIQQFFSTTTVTGKLATEAYFREHAKDYDILHLATHGVIDQQQPFYSRLVFSPGIDSSTKDDGQLHLYELLNLKFHARLVTLSACNTGRGDYLNGEGVMSLARGFSYAGCANLVMSLWAVPDQSTATLMTFFYQGLAQGLSKDEALRQARLLYLENSPPEKALPYYWGSWVLTGDNAPLKQSLPLWWIWAGGLLLLVAFSWWMRKRLVAGR